MPNLPEQMPPGYTETGLLFCDIAPTDRLHIGTVEPPTRDPLVLLGVFLSDEKEPETAFRAGCLLFTAAKARAAAAALLNAADELDGTTKLAFMPRCALPGHVGREPRR